MKGNYSVKSRFAFYAAGFLALSLSLLATPTPAMSKPNYLGDNASNTFLAREQAKSVLKPVLGRESFGQLGDLSALTVCFAMVQKIDFKTASAVATSALSRMVYEQYGNRIEGVSGSTNDQRKTYRWIAANILLKTATICPSRLPPNVLADAEALRKDRINSKAP